MPDTPSGETESERRSMLEGIDRLARACALRDQEIRDLKATLSSIRRRAASNPTRTFDDAIYDLGWIADETACALTEPRALENTDGK